MNGPLKAAGIAAGALMAGAGAATIGAVTLFNRVIPRQDGVKVDTSEMASEEQWEFYQRVIQSRKEWFLQQEIEHVTITSRDGLTLCGDYVPAPKDPVGKLLIAFHGYTSSRMGCSTIAVSFLKRGYDVLIVDARAHGESEGKYSGFGILDRFDCLAWIDYVNRRFDGKKDIILHGVSMGGATVLMASGLSKMPENVKAVIADCAFTSPYDVFAHVLERDYKLPPFPIMNITDEICKRTAGYGFKEYSTLAAMSKTTIPTLFIHGKNDRFVPMWMSEKNYQVCTAPKDLLLVDNAKHGASLFEAPELYENKIFQFLGKYAG
ncbi:MAG: alpha/beta hydrolase [Oscillospiraceae bacterium]|nr:alpha/beta hydrolase [Oscillospiraceae bacterium]